MHWWVSVTPAQVISIMLAPIPWTQAHGVALTKYIIFGTHFPNISSFAICGPAAAIWASRGGAQLWGSVSISIATATITVMQI